MEDILEMMTLSVVGRLLLQRWQLPRAGQLILDWKMPPPASRNCISATSDLARASGRQRCQSCESGNCCRWRHQSMCCPVMPDARQGRAADIPRGRISGPPELEGREDILTARTCSMTWSTWAAGATSSTAMPRSGWP